MELVEERAKKEQTKWMGLEKTFQTISILARLKGNGFCGPCFIIAPLSALSNWLSEIERFVPSLDAIIYFGDKK